VKLLLAHASMGHMMQGASVPSCHESLLRVSFPPLEVETTVTRSERKSVFWSDQQFWTQNQRLRVYSDEED
jgi:hypothetical protein